MRFFSRFNRRRNERRGASSSATGQRRKLRLESLETRDLLAANAIVAENLLPGNPPSEWDIAGIGDPTIQGYATDISVDQGETIQFKINNTLLEPYHINIYRIGYYGGMGARKVATIPSSQTLIQSQPAPLFDPATGLVDAGNWSVSASWQVPSDATSGVYIAVPLKDSGQGASHIIFVVRDDDGGSDMLFQTSDTTWQAYNSWGGNSLYVGAPGTTPDRAYAVSYNRPFNTRHDTPKDWFFSAEYPMVRWLEANGYDVSYSTGVDTDRRGEELFEHKLFLSVGHDEYWSGQQRTNVEAARDAGVHLAFFSGNEVYWRTRWETSIDGSGTPYRTLVSYKETHNGAKIDPADEWTGTWRDPRFATEEDGVIPENALTGQIFTVNRGPGGNTGTPFEVPAEYANLRFWRGTSVAGLQPGEVATLGQGVLGYEWDEDLDNGYRPAGSIRMSSTTQAVPSMLLSGYGAITDFDAGTATHHLTMHRAESGALVFGAGTVQWAWGLDASHEPFPTTPSTAMRQATVNLFADMGVQPATLQPGLVAATMSIDVTAPTSAITSFGNGAVFDSGSTVVISGTANDSGGVVGAVEVSTDGGATWRLASGTSSWSYTWVPSRVGPTRVMSRAADDSGNVEEVLGSVDVTVQLVPTSSTGLVAAYGFDEGSGSTLVDSSGNGNHGAISGASWTAGFSGQALAFDGIDDLVQVANAASLNLGAAMTVEAWVRPNDLQGYSTVLLKQGPDGLGYALYSSDDTGKPPAGYIDTDTSPTREASGVSPLPIGSWSHLATVYDGSQIHLYVNGRIVGSRHVSGNISASTGDLTIGGNNVFIDEQFNGLIDEVRVFNRALSEAEILYNMTTSVGGASDQMPPSVSIAEPAEGAVASGHTVVAANAADNIAVASVEFFVDGQPLGLKDTAAPFAIDWDTRLFTNGTHVLTALARDSVGNTTLSAAIDVTVDNPLDTTPPTVALAYPEDGAIISATVPLWAVADDDIRVESVRFQVDGNDLGTADPTAPYRIALDVASLADGPHALTAIARDLAGNESSTSVTVNVDKTLPALAARSPADASTDVANNVNVTATFSEVMQPLTISFVLEDALGNSVPAVFAYDEVTRVATLNPQFDLALNTTYTARVTAGRDLAGNAIIPVEWTFTTGETAANVSIWDNSVVPSVASAADAQPIEVGVKFRANVDGYITGLRFFKGIGNTGTHVGRLWTESGQLLATATFSGESASGWQQVDLPAPVAVVADTTYVASYYAPNGNYAVDSNYFATSITNGPLTALSNEAGGGNGLFRYGAGGGFPQNSYGSSNYWVDVLFNYTQGDIAPPAVVSATPASGETEVSRAANVVVTFSEPVVPETINFTLKDSGGSAVPAVVSYNATNYTVTLNPDALLGEFATYTATISGAQDAAGNTMLTANWFFVTGGVDTSPPVVLSRTPEIDATNVSMTPKISVKFNESVVAETISMQLFDDNNEEVFAEVVYSEALRTVTLIPWDPDGPPLGCCNACMVCPLLAQRTYTVVLSGAEDLVGNAMTPTSWAFTTAPLVNNASLWNESIVPTVPSAEDGSPVELGVKFTSSLDGYISGLRFYKGAANSGTHVGRIWTSAGQLLGTAIFENETNEGWQTVEFAAPIAVAANTTYVASYYAPNGRYAYDGGYFAGGPIQAGPLTALADGADGGNGVYRYGTGGGFPSQTYNASNYWVDVVFRNSLVDSVAPQVTNVTPANGAGEVSPSTTVAATFDEAIQAASMQFELRDGVGNVVSALVSYDASTRTATLAPSEELASDSTYTARLTNVQDAAGNVMSTFEWSFTTSASVTNATIWPSTATPAIASAADTSAIELGVKFRADQAGSITGLRFYKGPANTGTHVGHVWTESGALLGSVTFTAESASGWQQANFTTPVAIQANTTYVASYYAPNGGYAVDGGYFSVAGVTNGPLTALADAAANGNGVYLYASGGGFPAQTYNASNYWVDVVFGNTSIDITPPVVVASSPSAGSVDVALSPVVTATFNESVQSASIEFELRDASNALVAAVLAYDDMTRTTSLTPDTSLAPATTYTATIRNAQDAAGNAMAEVSWSFTTRDAISNASLWNAAAVPATSSAADPSAVELGVKFQSDLEGYITGLRFYKGPANTGTHVGNLWTAGGELLATAVFQNETAEGWQQVDFDLPVAISAGTTYVASYHAPNGGYAVDGGYFGSRFTNGTLQALSDAESGGNGVFSYGNGGFPTSTYNAGNYWVDIVFNEFLGDSAAPTVIDRSPPADAVDVAETSNVTVTFSEAVQEATIVFSLTDAASSVVPGTFSYNAATRTAVFDPQSPLALLSTYTAAVSGAIDAAGNAMAPLSWSFTTIGTWSQTSAADFTLGVNAGTSISPDGAISLAVAMSDVFDGTSLSSQWTSSAWSGGDSATVSGGELAVAGRLVLSAADFVDEPIEGRVAFGGEPYQHFGLATSLSSAANDFWAVFGTAGTSDRLFARVNAQGATQDVDLGPLPAGYHNYRVEPTGTGFAFYVDGQLQTTISIAFPPATALRATLSAYLGSPAAALRADWVRVGDYPTGGAYTSVVLDAGGPADWGTASWTSQSPAGTSIIVETRSGNSATPDETWSDWTPVAGNSVSSPSSRYLQYRVIFSTGDTAVTPLFLDILVTLI